MSYRVFACFQVMVDEGLTELMFTSDNLWIMEQEKYRLPGGTTCTIHSSSFHFTSLDCRCSQIAKAN